MWIGYPLNPKRESNNSHAFKESNAEFMMMFQYILIETKFLHSQKTIARERQIRAVPH